jgi:hypothetical protein
VRQRGLAAAGRPGEQVERELGQAAAEHLVEARYAGWQSMMRCFAVSSCVLSCAASRL